MSFPFLSPIIDLGQTYGKINASFDELILIITLIGNQIHMINLIQKNNLVVALSSVFIGEFL